MGRVKLLSLFLGAGSLAALVPALLGGCLQCDEYLECTAKPGLRYVACGDKQHEFNDGASLDDEDAAWDYCFCGAASLACKGGASLRMCNYMTYDGTIVAYFNEGTSAELTTAVSACLGYDGCFVETTRCNFGGWYLNCAKGEERRYVSGSGAIFQDETNAVDTCVARGHGGFRCEPIIDDCDDLDSCALSNACSEFCSSPACFNNKSAASCIKDPACRWTP